ncbi:MAG: HAD family hydrolase [Clostridia bacterium]|nr:HAD family hydrolase [Clostridia bacterium]
MKKITNIIDVPLFLDGISVAIFDLDDTLYSEKEYVRSGFNAVAKQISCVDNMAEKLWCVFENGGSAIDEVLKSEGIYSEERKVECLKIYRLHTPEINLYEGVRDMLLGLKNNGIRLAMITDGRAEGQRAKIKALRLHELFDKIIITDELGGVQYRKPNEKSFVMMQKHFSVGFNEMSYVGDNLKKDFIAPQKLGMRVIFFINPDGLYTYKNG